MKARGFTLVELMVAVAVFAILASLAVPSFQDFTSRQRLRAASFDLRTDLVFTRSEALKRNQNVVIRQRQADGWQTGWVVEVGGAELRSRNGVGAGVSVASATNSITFNGSGRVAAPAGTVQIALSGAHGSSHLRRCLVLDPAGMPRSYTEACQ